MGLPPSEDDELLLDELRTALADPGPVPDDFVVAARAAFAWRDIDAELAHAELTFDSVWDAQLATRSGPDAATRSLAFHGGGVSVEVEAADATITGQVTPADGCQVTCQTADGTFDETTPDAVGCFVLRSPASGPVRLRLSYGERVVATSWVRLG